MEEDVVSSALLMEWLRDEVGLLARPAADQERWMDDTRFPVDEMALQFYDTFLAALPRLTDRGILTPAAGDAIRALDAFLDTFSGKHNGVLWTREALRTEPVWIRVRELAGVAADLIEASPGLPGNTP